MKKIFEKYYVSKSGIIRPDGRSSPMKPWNNSNGYKKISLRINGSRKNKFVHRLVAQAYIPNPNNLPHVNHKNGNRADNRVENLEWCTAKQNNDHAIAMGTAACVSQRLLSENDLKLIRTLRRGGYGALKISRALSLPYNPISDYIRGRTYLFDPIDSTE